MNNKRMSFYFVCLLILVSLFGVYLVSATNIYTFSLNNVTISGTVLRQNITIGSNMNITCTAEAGEVGDGDASGVIVNVSLWHNFATGGWPGSGADGSILTLNMTNGTANQKNYTGMTQNDTLAWLSAQFLVLNGTVTYDANGDQGGTNSQAEGNYTVACQAGVNITGSRNFTSNLTMTIDKTQPKFNYTLLNVTDGFNTVIYTLMNGTLQAGKGAYLRNNTNLTISVSITEPHVDKVILYWTKNYTTVNVSEFRTRHNPYNLTLNKKVEPSGSKNLSVLNGSFLYGGAGGEFSLGYYKDAEVINFMIVANDSAGNIRNLSNGIAGFNITIDGSAPAVTFTLNKERMEVMQSITATCSNANDTSPVTYKISLVKPSGATVEKTPLDGIATFTGQGTGEAGKYSVKCEVTDTVGWTSTETKVFTAYYEGESVSEVSEEEVEVAEVDLSKTEAGVLPEGKFVGFKKGEAKSFTLDGVTKHTMTFLDMKDQEVTLRFESTPVDVTLKLGETKEVDIDGDGQNDFKVTLNSFTLDDIDVNIKPIEKAQVQEQPETSAETPTKAKISGWAIAILVIVILAVIVVAYFLVKKGKGKKGEVRFTSKDLSSEFNF